MSDSRALFEAVQTGDTAAVARLTEEQPELLQARDERGVSVVLLACYCGQKEIRDSLIEKGTRLELHEAAAAGQLARVKELLSGMPQLARSYSPDGFPVMALAAAFGHEAVARYLHAEGAEINAVATNGTGYTALTGAVAGGHAAVVEWLAGSGADVNYRYKGYSPLLTAAANGHLEIVKMLMARGADAQARTDDGKSAVGLAEQRGHQEVADYLRGLGVSP